jgi:hypothetical protein
MDACNFQELLIFTQIRFFSQKSLFVERYPFTLRLIELDPSLNSLFLEIESAFPAGLSPFTVLPFYRFFLPISRLPLFCEKTGNSLFVTIYRTFE